MRRMFDFFLWRVSLRVGGIVIDIIHWVWWAYLVWEDIQRYSGVSSHREFRLIWPSLGRNGSGVKDFIIRVIEIPGSIFISIVLLAGILVRSHKCLIVTTVTLGLMVVLEGIFACYMNYFHQYTLTMRGHMMISVVVWIRVWFFFVVASLMDFMEVEARVHHIDYLRESFVLPFRRDMAQAAEDLSQGVRQQNPSDV